MLKLNAKKIQEIQETQGAVESLISDNILKKGIHYFDIPGMPKKILGLSGAELLAQLFDINIKTEVVKDLSDPKENLVDVTIKALAYDGESNFLGEALGNCNSMEEKFGFVWKEEHEIPSNISKMGLTKEEKVTNLSAPLFVIENGVNDFSTLKKEGEQYGKPKEHWEALIDAYKNNTGTVKEIENPKTSKKYSLFSISSKVTKYKVPTNAGDKKNTILKMAEKRAKVSVIKFITNTSDLFTQDLEEGLPQQGKQDQEERSPLKTQTSNQSQVKTSNPKVTNSIVYYPIANTKSIVNFLKKKYIEELQGVDDTLVFMKFLQEVLKLQDNLINIKNGFFAVLSNSKQEKTIKELDLFATIDMEKIKEIFKGGKDLTDPEANLKYKEYIKTLIK
jgi:hypothetical protein